MNPALASFGYKHEIRAALNKAQQFLIATHVRPDGDAIGSLLGFGLALKAQGKQIQMVIQGGFPGKYRFLSGSDEIRDKCDLPYEFSIALDCADEARSGDIFASRLPDLNIDHHATNTRFGKINLVLPEYAATAAILAELLPEWGLEISSQVASALMMGIVTDTIGFRTPNVDAKLLRMAAALIEKGAALAEVYKRTIIDQSFPSAVLWGAALNRMQRDGRLVWTSITLEDRHGAHYNGWDDADLSNFLSTIEECDVSVLFNEQKDDKVKVSWRSTGGLNIADLAVRFNGGGHTPAAGAELNGSLQAVQEIILKATKTFIKEEIHSQGEGNA